jgi:dihydrofolate reductase
MILSIMAAMSLNRAIGNKGLLPWGHLPADWAYLHRITKGKRMVMGRKSYDTPDRVWSEVGNIVITRQADFPLEKGFERAESLENALKILRNEIPIQSGLRGEGLDEVFIIGGAEIFKQAMPIVDKIYLTLIHATFEGDAFFPFIEPAFFRLIERQDFNADKENKFPYSFLVYERSKR